PTGLVEHSTYGRFVDSDRGDADLGALAQLEVPDLCHRNAKTSVQPLDQAGDDATFVLEAPSFGQVKLDDDNSYDHGSNATSEGPHPPPRARGGGMVEPLQR